MGGMSHSGPDRLTSDEVALVLRRAAELDASVESRQGVGGVEPAAVEEAAREVGLSRGAVRQALAELRIGSLDERGRGSMRLAGPRVIVESRRVAVAPEQVHEQIGLLLRKQTFQLRRRQGDWALYRPREDVVAKLRRGMDVGGTVQFRGISAVVVQAAAVDRARPIPDVQGGPITDPSVEASAPRKARDAEKQASSMVRLEADVSGTRRRIMRGAATSAVVVTGALGTAGLLMGEAALLVAAPLAGIAVGVARLVFGARSFRRRRNELSEALAALVDGLGEARDELVEGPRGWREE